MSQKASYQPEIDQDSTSAPNLARFERHPSSQPALKSVHLHNLSHVRDRYSPTSSRVHNAPFGGTATAAGGASSSGLVNEDNDSEIEGDAAGGPTRMTRAERKRIWRKNLSAEKIARLRERDALRKRVERQNMTPEKRRDLRTKDTARKAALRRERRMSGGLENPPGQGHQGQPATSRHDRGSDSTTTIITTTTNTTTTTNNINNHTNHHNERSPTNNEGRRHSRHLQAGSGSGGAGGGAGGSGGGGSGRESQRFFKSNDKKHEKKGKISIESLLN